METTIYSMFPILFGLGLGTSILTGVFGVLAVDDLDKKEQEDVEKA